MVYVFCGRHNQDRINSIETIAEDLLVSNLQVRWSIIEISQNNISRRSLPVVIPINDNEISIMGGVNNDGSNCSDILIFNTTTNTYLKVAEGGEYKFFAQRNQFAQAGTNKVVALVLNEDYEPSIITWTKGASSVNMLHRFIDEKNWYKNYLFTYRRDSAICAQMVRSSSAGCVCLMPCVD